MYGRQLPHEDASPPERYFLDFLYGPAARTQRMAERGHLTFEETLFSNVNSAIPRDVWERFPFAEDVVMSEDQEWSRRVLLAGMSVVYEPKASVHHSHAYSMRDAVRRFFDSGASADRSYAADDRHPGGRCARRVCVRDGRASLALEHGAAPLDPVRGRVRAREVRGTRARTAAPTPPDRDKDAAERLPDYWR